MYLLKSLHTSIDHPAACNFYKKKSTTNYYYYCCWISQSISSCNCIVYPAASKWGRKTLSSVRQTMTGGWGRRGRRWVIGDAGGGRSGTLLSWEIRHTLAFFILGLFAFLLFLLFFRRGRRSELADGLHGGPVGLMHSVGQPEVEHVVDILRSL